MTLSTPDLLITVAYFSIPLQVSLHEPTRGTVCVSDFHQTNSPSAIPTTRFDQLLWALCKFPRVTRRATKRVVLLLVLFALFIFLCGTGHLIRCLGMADTNLFRVVNVLTAVISLLTSIYLLPFVPNLLEGADKLYLEATASKKIIESLYPPTVRERLIRRDAEEGAGGSDDSNREGRHDQTPTKRPSGKLLDRMSRSDSTAVRHIHAFIQRRSRGSVAMSHSDEDDIEPEVPIADYFPDASIMFADISNFTFWCSRHSPIEVFTLLESLYLELDKVATEMKVFKLSTVGDCYIATAGVPFPREDHAVVLAQFATLCIAKGHEVLEELSKKSGMEDVDQLNIRIGIHSGPVTAGVLRGNNRFDIFGDSINTASRIESSGRAGMIHLSRETAEILELAGKADWLIPREEPVSAKGKGKLKTFWLKIPNDEKNELPSESSCDTLVSQSGIELTEQAKRAMKRRLTTDGLVGGTGLRGRTASDIV